MGMNLSNSSRRLLEEGGVSGHQRLSTMRWSASNGAMTPKEVASTGAGPVTGGVCPGQIERITVALVPAAQDGLRWLQEHMMLSKTDLANRAITSYQFFEAHMHAGHDVIVRNNRTGQFQVVWFL